jgi:DNA-binding transcriptional LysR family regulator
MPDDVQLPHLETFSRAAEASSFSAAARTLGLSQAAVSQRIATLESALGRPLFQRRGGRVLLTEAGHKLYAYAQRIIELHREARRQITGQATLPAGELVLAASSVPGEHLLPALLAEFRQRYPHVHVRAAVSDSMAALAQVERGEATIGLVGRKIDHPHLEFRPLATDELVLVAPKGHALCRRKKLSISQLASYPLVLREVGSGMRHCLERSLEQAGLSLAEMRVALELGSNEAIKEAVLRGAGVAVLSRHAVQRELQMGRLRAIAVSGLNCRRELYVVIDRRRVLTPPARLFLVFLENHALAIAPPRQARSERRRGKAP